MNKKIIRNEDGSALVLVMMVLVVLSFLGAALGMVTIGSLNLSTTNQDINSAYYIAQAGANMAYEEFKEYVIEAYNNDKVNTEEDFFKEIQEFDSSLNYNFEKQFDNIPTASVRIIGEHINLEDDEWEYIVNSVGEINNTNSIVEKRVRIMWQDKAENSSGMVSIPKNTSIMVKEGIDYTNGIIKGNVFIDSNEEKSFKFNDNFNAIMVDNIYTKYKGNHTNVHDAKDWMYKDNSFKSLILNKTQYENFHISWSSYDDYFESILGSVNEFHQLSKDFINNRNEEIVLDKNYKKNELLIQGSHTLNVGNNHITIVVNKLTKDWGVTRVKGTGSLTIMVLGNAGFTGNFNDGNPKGNLRILFPQKSDVISISNGGRLGAQLIAPYSEVMLTGYGTIYGAIVADKVNLKNGANIYPEYFTFDDKVKSPGTPDEHKVDIISTSPAIEQ